MNLSFKFSLALITLLLLPILAQTAPTTRRPVSNRTGPRSYACGCIPRIENFFQNRPRTTLADNSVNAGETSRSSNAVRDQQCSICQEPIQNRPGTTLADNSVNAGETSRSSNAVRDQQCSICQEPIDEDKFTSPCHHDFHGNCIKKYAKTWDGQIINDIDLLPCPNCREPIDGNQLIDLCPICETSLNRGLNAITSCGHLFHNYCIEKLHKKSKLQDASSPVSCPKCDNTIIWIIPDDGNICFF